MLIINFYTLGYSIEKEKNNRKLRVKFIVFITMNLTLNIEVFYLMKKCRDKYLRWYQVSFWVNQIFFRILPSELSRFLLLLQNMLSYRSRTFLQRYSSGNGGYWCYKLVQHHWSFCVLHWYGFQFLPVELEVPGSSG